MKASLVLAYLDRPAEFGACQRSIQTCGLSPEVIVVDNSPEGCAPVLLPRAKLLRHSKGWNIGYVEAMNWGMREAAGDFIVLMNADLVAGPPGWLAQAITFLQEHSDIGIIGPDARNVLAGGGIYPIPPAGGPQDAGFIVGSLLIMRREVFERTGGYDEGYSPCFWEDADLSFQCRHYGYRTVHVPFIEVRHTWGVSVRYRADLLCWKDKVVSLSALTERNRALFCAKWAKELSSS